MPKPLPILIEYFADLPDPRIERTRAHLLIDIIFISVCSVIAGAEGWDDIVLFAKSKQEWFEQRLELPNGIPCADTFRRVLSRLDPDAFEACFRRWTQELHEVTKGEVIALDGKTLRHSFDKACGHSAIHMVSAWATNSKIVLGQVKVDEKSNEIPAVPALLALLEIKDCIITADAMSCQKATATQIIKQEADYILAAKDNQPTLSKAIQARFEYMDKHPLEQESYSSTVETDAGHGRIETRQCDLITLGENDLYWGDFQSEWSGLRSLARVTSSRKTIEKTTHEVRYFISSLVVSAKKVLKAVRKHWGIENSLHYVLDVSFDEDMCRIRKDNGAEIFSMLRHIAINQLSRDKTCKRGIKARIKLAGWDDNYMSQLFIN